MTELWLKFTDEQGDDRKVLVKGEKFVIGRHPENDLSIPNSKLSREHVKIERFAGIYEVSDCGSSNGTFLNGEDLLEPVTLKNGDKLNLGGGVTIKIELAEAETAQAAAESEAPEETRPSKSPAVSSKTATRSAATAASGDSAIPTSFYIIAPVLGLMVLLCGGGLLFFMNGKDSPNTAGTNDGGFIYSTPSETPDNSGDDSPTPKPSATVANSSNGTTVPPTPDISNPLPPTPEVSSIAKKIEQNSAAFLRRIALNEPDAFISTTQVAIVNSKIDQFKDSNALAENLKAVKQNASQFESMAKAEGLKPQFLATAALAQLGNSRGNPLETAKQMLPILSQLRISLANNLADDNLLIIAAYNQGKAGKFKDLRNVLEALAKKNPSVSPREIRTIWFLKKQNKITDAEYEFALRFLTIGTITQNPKDFNVNAEAVIFN